MIELFGGVMFLFLNQASILNFFSHVVGYHVFRIPNRLILKWVEYISAHLTTDVRTFIAIILIISGLAKVILSINLVLRKLWAFPVAIAFLFLLIIYQTYKSFYFYSLPIQILNLVDVLIIIFIWKEYLYLKSTRLP